MYPIYTDHRPSTHKSALRLAITLLSFPPYTSLPHILTVLLPSRPLNKELAVPRPFTHIHLSSSLQSCNQLPTSPNISIAPEVLSPPLAVLRPSLIDRLRSRLPSPIFRQLRGRPAVCCPAELRTAALLRAASSPEPSRLSALRGADQP